MQNTRQPTLSDCVASAATAMAGTARQLLHGMVRRRDRLARPEEVVGQVQRRVAEILDPARAIAPLLRGTGAERLQGEAELAGAGHGRSSVREASPYPFRGDRVTGAGGGGSERNWMPDSADSVSDDSLDRIASGAQPRRRPAWISASRSFPPITRSARRPSRASSKRAASSRSSSPSTRTFRPRGARHGRAEATCRASIGRATSPSPHSPRPPR